MTNNISDFSVQEFSALQEEAYERLTHKIYSIGDTHKAFILGGQPGAGKTTLHGIININHDFIVINGDDFREYHPCFAQLDKIYGIDSPKYTQAFASKMTETMIKRLSDKGYNLIIEGTLRTADVPLKTAAALKEKGYSVELMVMAVSAKVSWQGTLDRYELMREKGMTARATTREHHDMVVAGLPENLSKIYASGGFENISLFDRSGSCLYSMAQSPGRDPGGLLADILNSVKYMEITDKQLEKLQKSALPIDARETESGAILKYRAEDEKQLREILRSEQALIK